MRTGVALLLLALVLTIYGEAKPDNLGNLYRRLARRERGQLRRYEQFDHEKSMHDHNRELLRDQYTRLRRELNRRPRRHRRFHRRIILRPRARRVLRRVLRNPPPRTPKRRPVKVVKRPPHQANFLMNKINSLLGAISKQPRVVVKKPVIKINYRSQPGKTETKKLKKAEKKLKKLKKAQKKAKKSLKIETKASKITNDEIKKTNTAIGKYLDSFFLSIPILAEIKGQKEHKNKKAISKEIIARLKAKAKQGKKGLAKEKAIAQELFERLNSEGKEAEKKYSGILDSLKKLE